MFIVEFLFFLGDIEWRLFGALGCIYHDRASARFDAASGLSARRISG